MPSMRLLLKLLALPLLTWLCADRPASAQVFGFGHVELYNGLRPGAPMPFDGAGYSHRLNYLDVPFYYIGPFGWNADYARGQYETLVELDRMNRAIDMEGYLKSFDRLGPLLPADRPPLSERIRLRLSHGR